MRLITTHVGADFDSLASLFAARRLLGGGTCAFSGSSCRNVREFLKRYGDRFPVLTPRRIDLDAVSDLVVVDARSRSRIGPFGVLPGRPGVRVRLFDHHPPTEDDIPADEAVLEPLGATTTLLVERILAERIPVPPLEATLFVLGIYEDTGALTFGATGEREHAAVAALRRMGADLSLVPVFVELSYTLMERRLLDRMIEAAHERYLGGMKAVFCALSFPSYVDGLSLFVHRLRDAHDADLALAVVAMDRRTYVVLRSRAGGFDSAEFLREYGGAGHAQAASLNLPATDPRRLLERLEGRLVAVIPPAETVERAMSRPVRAIAPDLPIEDAWRIMIRYGHAALPVVRGGLLTGLVTRKDLDKARLHGLGQVPVADFMTEGAIVISPEAPVTEAHRLMAIHNIGRLPVVREGRLVGILTRTDLLRALYPISLPPGEGGPESGGTPWREPILEMLERRLEPQVLDLLHRLGDRGRELNMRVHAVGGFVRDLLLGRPNLDLDVVVEGDALPFLDSFAREGRRTFVHDRFRTGTVILEGRKVDVATARREFYEYPTAQPVVERDSLRHDLYRRDFSVNAMAISLDPESFGLLTDWFGGRPDLERRTLRVLHNLSFVEDPTRILRAIRLEQRLRFRMEENSLRLMRNAVRGGLLALLSGGRLRGELELILKEPDVFPMTERMAELGVLEAALPGIRYGTRSRKALRRLRVFDRRLRRDMPALDRHRFTVVLGALLSETPHSLLPGVLDRLSLGPRERGLLERGLLEMGSAENQLGARGERPPSEIAAGLREIPAATALIWAASTDLWRLRRRILLHWTRLFRIEPMLTGRDLLELGVPGGPSVGVALAALRDARLDGEVETREEEIDFVRARFVRGLPGGGTPSRRRRRTLRAEGTDPV